MMTKALVKREGGPVVLSGRAAEFARRSRSDRTLKLYGLYWRDFETFADRRGASALPASPALVADYVSELAERGARVPTIEGKLAAVAFRHRVENLPDPTTVEAVKLVMSGIRRMVKRAPHKKDALPFDDLRAMVAALPGTLQGKRDKALLLVGFGGAFRRSELVALDRSDVRIRGERMAITVRSSKTDQEGEGQVKHFDALRDASVCPVAAMRAWLDAGGIRSGPVFVRFNRWGKTRARMTGQSVALVVKRAARAAGLRDVGDLSGHSLRIGFVTASSDAGIPERDIMAQTGHKSERVLRGYIRDAGRGARAAMRAAFGEGNGAS